MKNVSKVFGQFAWVSAVLTGCSGPVDGVAGIEQENVAVQTSEIKYGTLFDGSGVWNGVVKVEFWSSATSSWLTCSGQIVSGRSIVTAAHCVTAVAVGNPVSTWVRVSRPAYFVPGWWQVLPDTWAYVKYNPAYIPSAAKSDIALVILPNGVDFQNVFMGDAVALSKTAPNSTAMTALGFGYYEDNLFDGLGRSGGITPTYNTTSNEYTYSSTGTQPRLCRGDSGGPLKTTSLIYGFMSLGAGITTGKCSSGARWATSKDNMTWLKSNIVSVDGCTETSSQYRCW